MQNRDDPAFHNARALLQQVDRMPGRPPWLWKEYVVHAPSSNAPPQRLEMWYCDPVELVAELLGNPLFASDMFYAPRRRYSGPGMRDREYCEMNDGDWWWDMQVRPVTFSITTVTLTRAAGTAAPWGDHRSRHPCQ
jgi:hypothetical protein